MAYASEFPKSFKRRLKKKPPDQQAKVLECVKRVCDDPYHPGLQTSKMGGTKDIFEARITGGNRLTFQWKKEPKSTIVFRNNCKHDDVLANP